MGKEKFENSYEEYQDKLRLIKELADEFNDDKEFNLEGESRITSTPDQIVVPITYKDGKQVERVFGTFKSSGQDIMKTPLKSKEDIDIRWIPTSDIIRSLLKHGSEFNSNEPQLVKKCLERLEEEKKEQEKK